MERKSTRSIKSINPAAIEIVAKELIKKGYEGFLAREHEHNNSLQNCDAEFLVDGRIILGRTGDNKGHAEMDAIHNFIVHYLETKSVTPANDVESLEMLVTEWHFRYAGNIFISCTGKNCCFRCSVILGLMNIKPFDDNTTKGAIAMGATQWSTSLEVRKFLAAYLTHQNPTSNLNYESVVSKLFQLLASSASDLRKFY